MAARKHWDHRKFSSCEKQQYVIFDCSNHLITGFCSTPADHCDKFDRLKRVAVDVVENTRATKRTKSLFLDTLIGDPVEFKEEDISDEDSDAESLPTDVSDDNQYLNNLFHDEGTRKKLKLLAGMVGADNMEPGIVLAKVVTVLKDLTSNGC
ncbi:hypothetical protein REPUB_Repub18cG0096500 [Reevesia pubescens]